MIAAPRAGHTGAVVMGGKGSLAAAKGVISKGVGKGVISTKTARIAKEASRAQDTLLRVHRLDGNINIVLPGTPEHTLGLVKSDLFIVPSRIADMKAVGIKKTFCWIIGSGSLT